MGIATAEAAAGTVIAVPKYRHVVQTAAVVASEEGVGALYKGLTPTVFRQGCNQVMGSTVRGSLVFSGPVVPGIEVN